MRTEPERHGPNAADQNPALLQQQKTQHAYIAALVAQGDPSMLRIRVATVYV